jgi:hypothetical protein
MAVIFLLILSAEKSIPGRFMGQQSQIHASDDAKSPKNSDDPNNERPNHPKLHKEDNHMADINEIKESVMDTLGSVADVTRDLAAKAAEKARQGARIAKLTVETAMKRQHEKAYKKSEAIYETRRTNPRFLRPALRRDHHGYRKHSRKEAEIAELKSRIKTLTAATSRSSGGNRNLQRGSPRTGGGGKGGGRQNAGRHSR